MHKTGLCGTVKKSRKHMPVLDEPLQKKDVEFRSTDSVLCTAWMDKREVFMLSTVHEPLVQKTKSRGHTSGRKIDTWKPSSVVDYNVHPS